MRYGGRFKSGPSLKKSLGRMPKNRKNIKKTASLLIFWGGCVQKGGNAGPARRTKPNGRTLRSRGLEKKEGCQKRRNRTSGKTIGGGVKEPWQKKKNQARKKKKPVKKEISEYNRLQSSEKRPCPKTAFKRKND